MKLSVSAIAAVAAVAVTALVFGSTGAVAGSLITGKQIKDNTVSSKDIRNKTIATKDLAPKTVASLRGKRGPAGSKGSDGRDAWQTIPSGQTVSGYFYETGASGTELNGQVENINLPGVAPALPTAYAFAPDSFAETTGDDPSCSGTLAHPTAPAGKVCVYLNGLGGFTSAGVYHWDAAEVGTRTFFLSFTETAANTPYYYYGAWAYTAP